MNIELSKDELALLEMLLDQEESETNIEIHHSRNMNYKEYLQDRLKMVKALLAKTQSSLGKAG